MSIPPPSRDSAFAVTARTDAGRDMYPATAACCRPVSTRSSSTSRVATSSEAWYWMHTDAPRAASSLAIAAPRFREDAVTRARLPSRNCSTIARSAAMTGCFEIPHYAPPNVLHHAHDPVHELAATWLALGR